MPTSFTNKYSSPNKSEFDDEEEYGGDRFDTPREIRLREVTTTETRPLKDAAVSTPDLQTRLRIHSLRRDTPIRQSPKDLANFSFTRNDVDIVNSSKLIPDKPVADTKADDEFDDEDLREHHLSDIRSDMEKADVSRDEIQERIQLRLDEMEQKDRLRPRLREIPDEVVPQENISDDEKVLSNLGSYLSRSDGPRPISKPLSPVVGAHKSASFDFTRTKRDHKSLNFTSIPSIKARSLAYPSSFDSTNMKDSPFAHPKSPTPLPRSSISLGPPQRRERLSSPNSLPLLMHLGRKRKLQKPQSSRQGVSASEMLDAWVDNVDKEYADWPKAKWAKLRRLTQCKALNKDNIASSPAVLAHFQCSKEELVRRIDYLLMYDKQRSKRRRLN